MEHDKGTGGPGKESGQRRAHHIPVEHKDEQGIACNVHYKPLPMMTAYKNLGFDIADFPNAYDYFKNEITLPLHTKLTDAEVEYVAANFEEAVKKHVGC